jgi:uncharacterized membrane protein YcaP (DUF421 family)
MEWIDTLFGHGQNLSVLQMSCRAFISFFIVLIFLRIAGTRTFGKKTAFDTVIIIMLGSVMSRAVVGASPFIATSAACFVFVVIHWSLAKLSYYSGFIGSLVKGEKLSLYKDGMENEKNMRRAAISKKDLEESVRININDTDLHKAKEIFIERTGEVSIIK